MHVILLCNELLKYSMSALIQKIVEDKIVIHNNKKTNRRLSGIGLGWVDVINGVVRWRLPKCYRQWR